MTILWTILLFVLMVIYTDFLDSKEVPYHTCKVRARIGNLDIDDFEKKRPARSVKAECFRICYAMVTDTKYYTNTCLAGTKNYTRWFRIFRCPKEVQSPSLLADGFIPDEFKPTRPTNLCPGWTYTMPELH